MTSVSNVRKLGHMACYCPHIRCFDYNNYGHVAADCPDKIPPSGTLAWYRDNTTSRHDRSASGIIATPGIPTVTIETGTGFSWSRSHSHNPRYRSNSHSDSCRSCSRSFHPSSCHSSSCHRSSSTYCYCHDTSHCRSSSHRNFSRDESRSRTHKSNRHHYIPTQRSSSVHNQHPGSPWIEGTNRLQLMIHPQNIIALMNRTVIQRWFKLEEPSPSSHTWGGLPNKDAVTIAHIIDCTTIIVHAGKHYKVLIDSGTAISLLRYSTYKKIEDFYKTPIQPTTSKLKTADGSPMMALDLRHYIYR